MKLTTLLLLLCCGLAVNAQTYNNEWIDYNKTYYKFKVPTTGLYRINQPALPAALQSVQAQHFQLWRNGEQIPVYTSIATGVFGGSDYIEFWGERNDGRPDNSLYRDPANQLNNKHSLETDTATYFLTVNTASANRRLETTPNIIPPGATPDPYFMYTMGKYWQERMNPGFSQREGDNTFSSAYEGGEGWASLDIQKNGTLTVPLSSDLHIYTGAGSPDGSFRVHGSGNSYNVNTASGIYHPRTFQLKLNGQALVEQEVPLYDFFKETRTVPLSLINTNVATVSITNISTMPDPLTDRVCVAMVELTYPRQFNFDNLPSFAFKLPASAGNYLQINSFNSGSSAILYDLTNGKRYVADITTTPGVVKVQMEPSAVERQLVLVSMQPFNISNVTTFTTRNFVNYGVAANQGDYLIISHPFFANGPNGSQPLEAYKTYRSSAAGGGYNAKIYMIDQLIDQFAFGIKQHPLAIRNFIRWSRATYSNPLKNILLIGRGQNYIQNRNNEAGADIGKLSFVPTFGQPASDILLSAEPGPDETPLTPIGRISVVQPEEISVYLNKVMQYEQEQITGSPLTQDKAWKKNFVHVVGASEPFLVSVLEASMNSFKQIAIDTSIGAKVSTFSKSSVDIIQQLSSQQLQTLFREGVGMLTYFGHANATALEYNLDDPYNYDNQSKYPLFLLLGCNAGNFFNYNPARLQVKETISEKYVLADNRGSIACIAGTSLGVVNGLETYAISMYNTMSKTHYGKTLGEIMQETIRQVFIYYSPESHLARIHCEQTLLHGDPAIRINPASFPKPDYVIEDPMVSIAPTFISIADSVFKIKAKFQNIGKAINRDIVIELKRTFPDNSTPQIIRDTIPGIRFIDSLEYSLKISPQRDKGLNRITISVEADQVVDEIYETNNNITKDVFIYEDEARPVSPLNFAIVNTPPVTLYASTANPFAPMKTYVMELDTTENFNSPSKVVRTISSTGGLLDFAPGITFTDSTVYYWRVASTVTTGTPNWNTASFIYLPASDR
ncbi:MAG TPA: C25 family cysteine peptidase [Chitinophagaceae bacterium]|nr:C25 family cysteine peptidase [Chitinophagaceae bacterium]